MQPQPLEVLTQQMLALNGADKPFTVTVEGLSADTIRRLCRVFLEVTYSSLF